ncbi:MAG TPA: AAA family ATPase [Phototrophicaceae bacterium]|nr:AAA family ATPase [Phototrophicaceae bacterium]
MQRIIVIGTSGSGKTTLAHQLARQLDLPHIELDALHWENGWAEAPEDVFLKRIYQAIEADRWVIDGNHSRARSIMWARADTLIWLDYPRSLVMWRVFHRSLRRVITRQKLWNTDNTEGWRQTFFSRDSVIWWAWTTYDRRRREYPILIQQPEYAHLTVLRFTMPYQTNRWLKTLSSPESTLL